MRKKLTTKTIDSLPPAKAKRYEVRDTIVPGLHIRVSATGGKVWYLSTRINDRARRIKLGSYPVLSLADARQSAQTLLRDVALGKYDERGPESPQSVVPTFAEIVPQFVALYAKPRTKDWKGTQSILAKFSSLNKRPIDQIKRADVVRVLDTIIADGTPTRANRALAAIKKLMNWCVDRGVIETSPVAHLRPPTKEVARERVLTDDELAGCWKAAEAEDFPFAAFVQLLILTGQRRGEVAGMRWSELDLDRATWTIPAKRAKNATSHIVPLAPSAISILNDVPRFVSSDLVFTTTGETPISGFGRLKDRLDVGVGFDAEEWRLHDLRRTVATNMAMSGVQPHIIEAVLNHKSGIVSGVAAVYNRHAYLNEKREALEAWAETLMTIVQRHAPTKQKNASRPSGSICEPQPTNIGA